MMIIDHPSKKRSCNQLVKMCTASVKILALLMHLHQYCCSMTTCIAKPRAQSLLFFKKQYLMNTHIARTVGECIIHSSLLATVPIHSSYRSQDIDHSVEQTLDSLLLTHKWNLSLELRLGFGQSQVVTLGVWSQLCCDHQWTLFVIRRASCDL